jgi:hypothetical protein
MMYVVLFRSVKEAVRGRAVGWRGVEPHHVPPPPLPAPSVAPATEAELSNHGRPNS